MMPACPWPCHTGPATMWERTGSCCTDCTRLPHPACSLAALRHELRSFLAETGLPRNKLPTANQLVNAGRGDLYKVSGMEGIRPRRLLGDARPAEHMNRPSLALIPSAALLFLRRPLCGGAGSAPRRRRWAGRRSGEGGRPGPTQQRWHVSCAASFWPATRRSTLTRSRSEARARRLVGSRRRQRRMRRLRSRCLLAHACPRTVSWPARGGTTSSE